MSRHLVPLALPAGYRPQYALGFHGRDEQGVAEQVEDRVIRKGVLLDGAPVLLEVRFDGAIAHCAIDTNQAAALARARDALAGMLGLRIDPAAFALAVGGDALFAPLLERSPGLRVIQSASVFEALSWAIIGQQINLPFAIALRRSFIELAGRRHPSGLWCYPEAVDAARLDPSLLQNHKFSRAKAETLLRLARLVADGALDLDPAADPDQVGERLLAIKGIGPWTVNYALLRGYGYPDCSLHGDVAVRNAIGRLLGSAVRPTIAEAEAFLHAYRPHRTMAAAYLWASLG